MAFYQILLLSSTDHKISMIHTARLNCKVVNEFLNFNKLKRSEESTADVSEIFL